jgi:hypothetical protein
MTDNLNYPLTEREIMTTTYGLAFKHWDHWLNTNLCRWTPQGTRLQKLLEVYTSIYEAITNKGYKFKLDRNTFRDKFLTWAYVVDREYYYESCPSLVLPAALHRDSQLDRDEYDYIFDSDFWYTMQEYYDKENELFGTDRAATFFWANLRVFAYRYIDMINSRIVQDYDEREQLIEEAQIEQLIFEGVLARDKKGRLVSAKQVEDEYSFR